MEDNKEISKSTTPKLTIDQKITPFLWFDSNAEEAMGFYISIFPDSEILNMTRYNDAGPDGKSAVLVATMLLWGQKFMVLNGGPLFKFTEAVSFVVSCETQEEVDMYWSKLTADGGQESMCAWLKDKYGLSWQIVPSALGRLLGDPNPVKAKNVMMAMLKMRKIDIAGLQAAYDKE